MNYTQKYPYEFKRDSTRSQLQGQPLQNWYTKLIHFGKLKVKYGKVTDHAGKREKLEKHFEFVAQNFLIEHS